MPHCLILAPFPLAVPRHGGQVRTMSLARALSGMGWRVDTAGLYYADAFPAEERGVFDILVTDRDVGQQARNDVLFGDLHVANAAAADPRRVDQLKTLLRRLRPDVVQVEHPWSWLVLRAALPPTDRPKIVYSSHNLEWNLRAPLLGLDFNRIGADRLMAATEQLETEFAREADLVFSVSDIEAALIAERTGRDVAHVPSASDLAEEARPPHAAFSQAAHDRGCRYAAMMGSGYTPNVEGFFAIFPQGLGFLSQDEQVWVAGSLGALLRADPRYQDFRSINDTRSRDWGYLDEADKSAFFAAASCVIVPVHSGAGAKAKMADALASGNPVITTSHATEGYGPLLRDALDQGVYVADTPIAFRDLVRRALREGLAGCRPEVRERVSLARMTQTLMPLYAGLLTEHRQSGPGNGSRPADEDPG